MLALKNQLLKQDLELHKTKDVGFITTFNLPNQSIS